MRAQSIAGIILVGVLFGQTVPPVTLEVTEHVAGSTRLRIHNNSSSSLTAIVLATRTDANSSTTTRIYDAALKQWSRIEPSKSAEIVMAAGQQADASGLLAAVFEDGTVVGEASAIKPILNGRRSTLEALDIVLKHMPSAHTLDADAPAQFQSARQDELSDASAPELRRAVVNVNLVISRLWMKGAGQVAGDGVVERAYAMLRNWRSELSSSKPNL